MKISVVIPAYNEEKLIKKCLDSLSNQTRMPSEIIIADNNSTDNTVKIASNYQVKIISATYRGISFARNAGFNFATGDIIARCDADTILPVDWVEKIEESFAKDISIIAVSGPAYFHDLPFQSANIMFTKIFYFRLTKLFLSYYPLFGANMAIRKNVWEKVKDNVCTTNSVLHEDMDLAIHIHKLGKIFYNPSLTVITTARRFSTYLTEYPFRWLKTILIHINKA